MTTDENEEDVDVAFSTVFRFFKRYYGCSWLITSQLGMLYFTLARIANDYILGDWAEKPEHQHTMFYLYGPLCLAGPFAIALGVFIRGANMQLYTWRCAKLLH